MSDAGSVDSMATKYSAEKPVIRSEPDDDEQQYQDLDMVIAAGLFFYLYILNLLLFLNGFLYEI